MRRRALIAFWTSFSITVLLSCIFVVYVYSRIPTTEMIRGCFKTTMNHVDICPGSKSYVPYSAISPYLVRSVVASEDASFWNHEGFDWDELKRSIEENIEAGTYKRGGSTITQQLAKNLFLNREKTLFRKGLEALITRKIEKTLSKREILERYLNVVEFGDGIFGVRSASRHYFDKSPGELDLLDAAFLTMLLPSPIKYSVSFRKKEVTPFARRRIKKIIADLERSGQVTEVEADQARHRLDWMFKDIPEESQDPLSEPVDPELEMELEIELDREQPIPSADEAPTGGFQSDDGYGDTEDHQHTEMNE